MRVQEIKDQLHARHIPTQNFFEKEELVRRLAQARQDENQSFSRVHSTTKRSDSQSSSIITAPLLLCSMDNTMFNAASNITEYSAMRLTGEQPPIPTVQLELQNDNKTHAGTLLTMLIDTAASDILLRPETRQKHDLPTIEGRRMPTAVASGAIHHIPATALSFRLGGAAFGPFEAAFQDFPYRAVDGILGLSFLERFAAVEFGFREGRLLLHRDKNALRSTRDEDHLLTKANMRRQVVQFATCQKAALFTVDVCFGSRGPVTMLVDTGAAQTFLNWDGAADLGLSKDSEQLAPARTAGMGGDNVVLEMSHEWVADDGQLRLGSSGATGKGSGVPLAGANRLTIAIGEIPGLANMPIGGILGMDAFLRCGLLRCSWQEPFGISMYR